MCFPESICTGYSHPGSNRHKLVLLERISTLESIIFSERGYSCRLLWEVCYTTCEYLFVYKTYIPFVAVPKSRDSAKLNSVISDRKVCEKTFV